MQRDGAVHGLLERLSPRRSLAAAIGWTLVALFFASAYFASLWVGSLARKRLEAQTGALYQQYALQVSNALDSNLYDRLQWLRTIADVFATRAASEKSDSQRALLERWRASLPELDWVAFGDHEGKVLAATVRGLEGQSVATQRWFLEGRTHAAIGGVRFGAVQDAVDLGAPHPFLDLGAPVRDADNRVVGVIGASLSWEWLQRLEASLTERLKSGRTVETLLVDRDGVVLLGPATLIGKLGPLPSAHTPGAVGQVVHRWADGEEYMAGYAVSDGAGSFPGLGWTVWVREPTATAFAEARALGERILGGLLALGLLGAMIGVAATARLTRDLAAIARSADQIRVGTATTLVVPAGSDEAARIGESLRMVVDGLQRERASLQALNAELDARVAARTRAVERMSEENKYAAIVRERLRMARDLHDTLAHSLMALLTEIRVLRKLAETNPGALQKELANAEAAAQEGLQEARAAITALRHNAVRDIGLGASLGQLLKRFEEREGIAVHFENDSGVDEFADSRAETLYRIVEEALHNVEQHARATHVEAAAWVASPGDLLTVSIADNGVGFDTTVPQPGHYGLRGMREQAELVGATLDVASSAEHGTRVTITMPI